MPCRPSEPHLHSARLSSHQAAPGHSPTPDPCTVGSLPLGPCWIHTLPRYLHISRARSLPWARPTQQWDNSPFATPCHRSMPVPQSPGSTPPGCAWPKPWTHHPSAPAEPQLCVKQLDPSPLGSLHLKTCWAPAPCGTTGALPCWDRHQPHLPVCQDPCLSGTASPSSTGFPVNYSTRLPLEEDTQRQDLTLKE
jgi:hypothetical protein